MLMCCELQLTRDCMLLEPISTARSLTLAVV